MASLFFFKFLVVADELRFQPGVDVRFAVQDALFELEKPRPAAERPPLVKVGFGDVQVLRHGGRKINLPHRFSFSQSSQQRQQSFT